MHTGKRGRPRKIIDPALLAEAFAPHRRISQSQLGRTIKVHRHTVRKNRLEQNIPYGFTQITVTDLDDLARYFKNIRPAGSGWRYFYGMLLENEIKVQKARVIASWNRVDAVGNAVRQRQGIRRRKYTSARPNNLWHLDGHHKLIRWGVVVHGIVDGFCRTVNQHFRFYIHRGRFC